MAKLKDICDRKDIIIKYAAPYMHEENGLAERGWRTVVTMKDSLLIDSGLPLEFWAEAMETANYLRNRVPTKSQRGELVPEEAWTGRKQDVSHVRVFGSTVSVLIPKEKRHKSDIHKNWKESSLATPTQQNTFVPELQKPSRYYWSATLTSTNQNRGPSF